MVTVVTVARQGSGRALVLLQGAPPRLPARGRGSQEVAPPLAAALRVEAELLAVDAGHLRTVPGVQPRGGGVRERAAAPRAALLPLHPPCLEAGTLVDTQRRLTGRTVITRLLLCYDTLTHCCCCLVSPWRQRDRRSPAALLHHNCVLTSSALQQPCYYTYNDRPRPLPPAGGAEC